jgi:hypothetical protein
MSHSKSQGLCDRPLVVVVCRRVGDRIKGRKQKDRGVVGVIIAT